jgi:preprotein translocase subunit SecD
MFTVIFLQIAVMSVQIAAIGTNPTLSICDIQHPESFLGERIVVNGLMAFTNHGIFLVADSCNGSDAEDVVVLFPKTEGAPKVDFDLDSLVSQKLRPFFRPIGRSTNACATLSGQVFYKKEFRSTAAGGGPQGNGFGPRGAFRLAFVIESVNDIYSCKRDDSRK